MPERCRLFSWYEGWFSLLHSRFDIHVRFDTSADRVGIEPMQVLLTRVLSKRPGQRAENSFGWQKAEIFRKPVVLVQREDLTTAVVEVR